MNGRFNGVYFKCQSEYDSIAIIPAFHIDKNKNEFATIQIITECETSFAEFPNVKYKKNSSLEFSIDQNKFSKNGISLNINTADLKVEGNINFSDLTALNYDIMGPFAYVPFMQCKHRVYSLRHKVSGKISVNNKTYNLTNSIGYIEGDSGSSFPDKYIWTQSFFENGSLMLSVANIPFLCWHFEGIIGFALIDNKQIRIGTYLGAEIINIKNGKIKIKQGNCIFSVELINNSVSKLYAPISGEMKRFIKENIASSAKYSLIKGGKKIFDFKTNKASFENEY